MAVIRPAETEPPTGQSGTSLRACPAATTTARAGRLARQLGITAVTDITALDLLGLPVFVSLRPAGQLAQVHAGKGLTADDARVGAWMEAVECAVAERASARGPYVQLPLDAVQAQLPGALSLADFAPRVDAAPAPDRAIAAVRCLELLEARRCLLPAELAMVPGPDEGGLPPLFGWTTNGLASGNTVSEATLHGLLEVLERDAIAMALSRGTATCIDLQTLPAPWVARAQQWRVHGVALVVRFLPNDFGLPCVEASLHQPDAGPLEMSRGWGMHGDRHVALARAVCEAAQARACTIHSRQPGMAALYGARMPADTAAAAQARQQFLDAVAKAGSGIAFEALPHVQHPSIEAALSALLARLQQAGFRHVFRRRMAVGTAAVAAAQPAGLHVVKVVVPRCENILGGDRRAGPRLVAQAAACA